MNPYNSQEIQRILPLPIPTQRNVGQLNDVAKQLNSNLSNPQECMRAPEVGTQTLYVPEINAHKILNVGAPTTQQPVTGNRYQPIVIYTEPVIYEAYPITSLSECADQFCICDFDSSSINPNQNFGSCHINTSSGQQSAKHYENLEEVKQDLGQLRPNMTKDEMYDEMLKPFKYQKCVEKDPVTHKLKVSYLCKYTNCNKEYTKTWNLLDHVRMHEGIKPFKCKSCHKAFTQKGNLKKHQIQHMLTTLKERKRFKCNICGKGYTEKYNLEVS